MKQVAIALDQLGNTLLGGKADETLSARAWRCQDESWPWGVACAAIDTLFFWQAEHCRQSWLAEFERRQLPHHYHREARQ